MLIRIACACGVLATYAFTGDGDYRHGIAQADHYRAMVCAGHWPDYQGREPVCPDDPVQPWDAYEPPPRQ